MKKKNLIFKILLLLLLGVGGLSTGVWAEKKAVEGNNEADVEFYEPTPKDPKPKDPKPKDPKPDDPKPKDSITGKGIQKILPKTGENSQSVSATVLGMILISSVGVMVIRSKRGGDLNEN